MNVHNAPTASSHREVARRNVVLATSVGALTYFTSRRSSAQIKTTLNAEVLRPLGAYQNRAGDLLVAVAAESIDLPTEARKQYRGEEAKVIRGTAAVMMKVPPGNQGDYVLASAYGWASYFASSGGVLLPAPEAIEKELSREPKFEPRQEKEGLFDVVLDIVLDTLGVKEIADALKDVALNRNAALKEVFRNLTRAFEQKNAAQAALEFEKLLRLLVSPGVIQELEKKLGREVMVKVMGRIALRLVPFLGWALWVASFIVAVEHNWQGIVKAI